MMHGVRFVVIAGNPVYGSVQSRQICFNILEVEGKVTKVVNIIAWFYNFVPSVDELRIHFIERIEWTRAITNDVFVPKVMVARKPDLRSGLTMFTQLVDPS
jgi:hypothetical protein